MKVQDRQNGPSGLPEKNWQATCLVVSSAYVLFSGIIFRDCGVVDLGTISETVVSSANFHIEERVLFVVRSLIMTKKSHEPIWIPR